MLGGALILHLLAILYVLAQRMGGPWRWRWPSCFGGISEKES